ncbi:unnamed protein product [Rotaria sordida]|uniref:Uncharacterized protein n=1 Tax=Rotaria sordida TaxID=392033 RepID=A0A819EQ06_9BILA|nr:unnamed protein product [Rotaria sordida]CAF3854685.1 unnamed protein product [Rotaria sordida]
MHINSICIVFFLLFVSTATQLLPNSSIVTANQSGDFNSLNTWTNNIRPQDNSTVIIPANITVYISDESYLNMNIQSLRIYGKLQIGSPNISSLTSSFRFSYSINIMIFDGGLLEDLTSNHTWFILPNSIISIYRNASFYSLQSTKIISNNSNQILNSTINGPYTLTVDLQGRIQNYLSITFVSYQSGEFTLNSVWIGGLSPTFDRCSPTSGGCILFIPAGIKLTRYNNQSTINAFDVHISGIFEISSWDIYLFHYPIRFLIYNGGIFQDASQKGLHFYINSSIVVDTGGLFITRPSNTISSYIDRNVIISSLKLYRTNITGPYQISIDRNGNIYDNGSLFTSTTIATTTKVTVPPGNTLTCYSCHDCDDPFNSNGVITVSVPANQGYYCRKSSIMTVVDRDVGQWCVQDNVRGNGLWCCQSNLCNHAKSMTSTSFLILPLTLIMILKLF